MKLATLKDGSRDGQLVVVSRDLNEAHYASGIASRLQQVLDDWGFMSPQLEDLYDQLNAGRTRHAFPFDPAQCMAPLPRAYLWASGAAYSSQVELLARQHGAQSTGTLPDIQQRATTEAFMTRGASDALFGACDAILGLHEADGIDFEAQLAVVTGDVPIAATPEQALDAVRLVMLASDVVLRERRRDASAGSSGFRSAQDASVQARPATAFSPVAVTPGELGLSDEGWHGGRVHLTLQTRLNGRKFGLVDTGPEMHFDFGQLIAHLAATRPLAAGSIVGSGPVSNRGIEKNGRTEWPHGHASIAEKRAVEALQDGVPKTAFMQFGDIVRIDMNGRDGKSLFGAIEQQVVAPAELSQKGRASKERAAIASPPAGIDAPDAAGADE